MSSSCTSSSSDDDLNVVRPAKKRRVDEAKLRQNDSEVLAPNSESDDELDITAQVSKVLSNGAQTNRAATKKNAREAPGPDNDDSTEASEGSTSSAIKNQRSKSKRVSPPKSSAASKTATSTAKSSRTSTGRFSFSSHASLSTSDEYDGFSFEDNVRTKIEDGKEKVVMTEDEDSDPYTKFKESRAKNPKSSKSDKARGQDKEVQTGNVRKKRQVVGATRKRGVKQHIELNSDDEVDSTVPENVQKLREEASQHDSLRLPPMFDEIEFAEDADLSNIEEKPHFPGSTPSRDYADLELVESRGVIPASIAQWLRDYQVDGAKFMHKNYVKQEGCILGDDMGLGKTIQVIAFLTAAFGKSGDVRDEKRMRACRNRDLRYPKVMIICPGTLISNWKRELDTWGWWHVQAYHGKKQEKEDALQMASNGMLEILITTYDTYRLDAEKLNQVVWDCVIADECHKVKEPAAKITEAMNCVNALCRIGLTGTAIMNKYGELWTLLNWVRPGELGNAREWKQGITIPLTIGQSHDATNAQLAKARKVAMRLVNNLLPRMFLRRMKTLIADQLPTKTDKVVFCRLTPFQQSIYETYTDSEEVQFVKYSTDPCDCNSGKTRGTCCHSMLHGMKLNQLVFPAIQNVLSLCNHFANWIPQENDPIEKQESDLEKLQLVLPGSWEKFYRRASMLNSMDPEFCGKWQVLKKLLAFWHEQDDKVLIFSYSKRLLKMLLLFMETTQYNVTYLDGDMALEERTLAVDTFNSDPTLFAFLISTRAGGVGLNITSANKVVIFDPSWNPSHDLQAQDRAYRIGQRRDVEVFRLVCAGTIEEIVYARQIYKQQQSNIGYQASFERRYFKGVQNDKARRGELFGLKNLFTFQQDNVILEDIVNKTNVAESRAGVAVMTMDSQVEEADAINMKDADSDPLSQIQAVITGDTGERRKPKFDPIQAILSSAGVEYTHNNTELIGSSTLEEQISKKATEKREDPDGAGQQAYTYNLAQAGQYIIGNVPDEVKKRQFNSMRKIFSGAETNEEFAMRVENWTVAQRREFLEKFYRQRRQLLIKKGDVKGHVEDGARHDSLIVIED